MAELSRAFANSVVPGDVQPGASAAIARDRADGARLIIASAAPEFYVSEIAQPLRFDDFIATRHLEDDVHISYQIDGNNCYGSEKLSRVRAWLAAQNIDRKSCDIVAYSDHISDGPLLDWADKGVFVTGNEKAAKRAESRGWTIADFAQERA